MVQVGGPYWHVPLGRKDSRTASISLANENIPLPNQGIPTLISRFLYQGLSVTDMVALVGKKLPSSGSVFLYQTLIRVLVLVAEIRNSRLKLLQNSSGIYSF